MEGKVADGIFVWKTLFLKDPLNRIEQNNHFIAYVMIAPWQGNMERNTFF